LNGRSTRAVPLPRDASTEQIVDWCASTGDLVAFAAALRWLGAEDWPEARSRLEHALLGPTHASPSPDSLAAQRDARSRLAVRFHKMQLLRAEDGSRRSNDLAERRRAAAGAAEGSH
jgi:hypothetical protein